MMFIKVELLATLIVVAVALVASQECGKLTSGNIEDKTTVLPWSVEVRERSTDEVICRGALISKQHVLIGKYSQ